MRLRRIRSTRWIRFARTGPCELRNPHPAPAPTQPSFEVGSDHHTVAAVSAGRHDLVHTRFSARPPPPPPPPCVLRGNLAGDLGGRVEATSSSSALANDAGGPVIHLTEFGGHTVCPGFLGSSSGIHHRRDSAGSSAGSRQTRMSQGLGLDSRCRGPGRPAGSSHERGSLCVRMPRVRARGTQIEIFGLEGSTSRSLWRSTSRPSELGTSLGGS